MEKLFLPKSEKPSAAENQATQGVKWSFAPGSNLLSGFGQKIDKESKQTLNEFAKELRAFRSIDMAGKK